MYVTSIIFGYAFEVHSHNIITHCKESYLLEIVTMGMIVIPEVVDTKLKGYTRLSFTKFL